MKKNFMLLLTLCFLLNLKSIAQFDPSQRQLSAGLKIIQGSVDYGKGSSDYTSDNSLGFTPTIRYEHPVRLFAIRDADFYLRLVGAAGFTYIKSKPVLGYERQPATGRWVEIYRTPHPLFAPLTFGLYTGNKFAVGTEATYWKGINADNLLSFKALSFMFNAEKFKTGAAFEVYQQLSMTERSERFLLSFEFYWNLTR
jgi:hypothetical protein